MQLTKKKHNWNFYAAESDEDDCLLIDLFSTKRSMSVAYDYSECADKTGRVIFNYRADDPSEWRLTPV